MLVQNPIQCVSHSVPALELIMAGWGSPQRGGHRGATPESRTVPSQGAREGRAGKRMIPGPALGWVSLPGEEGGTRTPDTDYETVSGAELLRERV